MSSALGDKLRSHRLNYELTLEQLAFRVGCAKSYLHDLESGKCTNPSLKLAARLGGELDIPIKVLAALLIAEEY